MTSIPALMSSLCAEDDARREIGFRPGVGDAAHEGGNGRRAEKEAQIRELARLTRKWLRMKERAAQASTTQVKVKESAGNVDAAPNPARQPLAPTDTNTVDRVVSFAPGTATDNKADGTPAKQGPRLVRKKRPLPRAPKDGTTPDTASTSETQEPTTGIAHTMVDFDGISVELGLSTDTHQRLPSVSFNLFPSSPRPRAPAPANAPLHPRSPAKTKPHPTPPTQPPPPAPTSDDDDSHTAPPSKRVRLTKQPTKRPPFTTSMASSPYKPPPHALISASAFLATSKTATNGVHGVGSVPTVPMGAATLGAAPTQAPTFTRTTLAAARSKLHLVGTPGRKARARLDSTAQKVLAAYKNVPLTRPGAAAVAAVMGGVAGAVDRASKAASLLAAFGKGGVVGKKLVGNGVGAGAEGARGEEAGRESDLSGGSRHEEGEEMEMGLDVGGSNTSPSATATAKVLAAFGKVGGKKLGRAGGWDGAGGAEREMGRKDGNQQDGDGGSEKVMDAPKTTAATKTAKVLAAFGKVGRKKTRGGAVEKERSGDGSQHVVDTEMETGGPNTSATPTANVVVTSGEVGGMQVARGGFGVEQPSASADPDGAATSDGTEGTTVREHDVDGAEGTQAPAVVTEPPALLAAPVAPSPERVDLPVPTVEGSVSAMGVVEEPCPSQRNPSAPFSEDSAQDPPSGRNHDLDTAPSTPSEIARPSPSLTSSTTTIVHASQQPSTLQPELTQPPPSSLASSATTLVHASQAPVPPTYSADGTQLTQPTLATHANAPAPNPRESAESAKSAESNVFVDAEEGRSSAGTHIQEIMEHRTTPTRESPGKENARPGVVLPPKSPFLSKGHLTLADRLKAAGMPKFNFVQPLPPPVLAGGKRDRASLKEPEAGSDAQGQSHVKRQKVDILGLNASQPQNSLSGGPVRVLHATFVATAGPQAPKPGVGLASSSWKAKNTKTPRAPAPAPVVQAQKGSWAATAWQPVPVSLAQPIVYAQSAPAARNPNPAPPAPPPRTVQPKPTPHPAPSPAPRQPPAVGGMKNPPKHVVRGPAAAPPPEPTRAIYEPQPPQPLPRQAVLATPPGNAGVDKSVKGGTKTVPAPPQSIVDANGGEIPDIPSDDDSEDSPRASGRTPQWARDKSVHEALIRQSQSQVPVEDIFGEVDPNVDLEAIFGRPIRKLKGRRSSVRWLKDDMSP